MGVDLTAIATMAAKYLTPALAESRARVKHQAVPVRSVPRASKADSEANKHSKYDRPVASMNPPLKFVAIALNDFGGIGFEFYSTVVKPYFRVAETRKLPVREKEEEAGGLNRLGRTQEEG